MQHGLSIAVVANFVLVAVLMAFGFRMFAQYHAHGRRARNVTALLSGLGMLILAAGMLVTESNAQVLTVIARTKAALVFLWVGTGFLFAAMIAFALLTMQNPLRLKHERHLRQKELGD